jgi:hypothetical protein
MILQVVKNSDKTIGLPILDQILDFLQLTIYYLFAAQWYI